MTHADFAAKAWEIQGNWHQWKMAFDLLLTQYDREREEARLATELGVVIGRESLKKDWAAAEELATCRAAVAAITQTKEKNDG